MTTASELADMFEQGEVPRTKALKVKDYQHGSLKFDLEVLEYKHELEQMELDTVNSHYQPDCFFRDYDWNAMYDEDRRLDDRGYISNLKRKLVKRCSCSDHIDCE